MDFLQALNSGLDNSIGLLESLPIKDEKVLAEVKDFKIAIKKVAQIYNRGSIIESILLTEKDF